MPNRATVTQLRAKYAKLPLPDRPALVHEEQWLIFRAVVSERRSMLDVGRDTDKSVGDIRQLLDEIDVAVDKNATAAGSPRELSPESRIEDLGLSPRSCNALHRLDCTRIREVLRLDLSSTAPRLGQKTRMEVLAALESAGYRHPAMHAIPALEVVTLARSLERMRVRIDRALRILSRDIGRFRNSFARRWVLSRELSRSVACGVDARIRSHILQCRHCDAKGIAPRNIFAANLVRP